MKPETSTETVVLPTSRKLAGLLVQFRYNKKPREETARELDVLVLEAKQLEAEIVQLHQDQDHLVEQRDAEEEDALESGGILSDVCDILFDDTERAMCHGYEGVKKKAEAILSERDQLLQAVMPAVGGGIACELCSAHTVVLSDTRRDPDWHRGDCRIRALLKDCAP